MSEEYSSFVVRMIRMQDVNDIELLRIRRLDGSACYPRDD